MNTFWSLPTAFEACIFVLCLVIARLGLRLPFRSAAVALLLLCPVPLAYLVAGSNSAIFVSDCVGVFCLLWLIRPHRGSPGLLSNKASRLPVILAALLLVVLPSVSSGLGAAVTGRGDWKLIAIGLFRGCAYLGLFCGAIRFGARSGEINKLMALQCVAFALICGCGILQAYSGLDLTLPSPTTAVLQGDLSGDTSAAGFMGLYRGAVGGWGAAMLGVIPLVLFRRRFGWAIAPACGLAVLAGIVLSGSRQGLVVGLIALALGTLVALASSRGMTLASRNTRIAIAAMALSVVLLFALTPNTFYDQWINSRFGSILEGTNVVDQVASRDDRMAYAIGRWMNNSAWVQVLGAGRGRLSDGITTYQGEVGYVDSEAVWQLQENGLLTIVTYAFFLFALARQLKVPKQASGDVRSTIQAARIVLIGGVLLLYGHFFLLHVQYSQAPVAYWNWSVLGAAIGTVVRTKKASYISLKVSDTQVAIAA